MIIGSYNIFEVSSRIENSDIGNFNHFEHKSTKFIIIYLLFDYLVFK